MARITKKNVIHIIIALVILAAVILFFNYETIKNRLIYENSPFWNEIINDNETEIKNEQQEKQLEGYSAE
ncbi:MAG: hypothetical protein LBV52_01130 [Spirochaetaceae bacterium]|jgi:dolichol kinase|nr:hypothetical protein [Spirochaetaceae bacterium]